MRWTNGTVLDNHGNATEVVDVKISVFIDPAGRHGLRTTVGSFRLPAGAGQLLLTGGYKLILEDRSLDIIVEPRRVSLAPDCRAYLESMRAGSDSRVFLVSGKPE